MASDDQKESGATFSVSTVISLLSAAVAVVSSIFVAGVAFESYRTDYQSLKTEVSRLAKQVEGLRAVSVKDGKEGQVHGTNGYGAQTGCPPGSVMVSLAITTGAFDIQCARLLQ
jgi:hypothetical protein